MQLKPIKQKKSGQTDHMLIWLAGKAAVCFDMWEVRLGRSLAKRSCVEEISETLLRFVWSISSVFSVVGGKENKLGWFYKTEVVNSPLTGG